VLFRSGTVTLSAGTASATYSITLPPAAPLANTSLRYDGANYVWGIASSTMLTNGVLALTSGSTLNRLNDSGKLVTVNTTTAGFTITLPASPQVGDNYYIKDIGGNLGNNPLTINPNGATFEGLTSNYVVYAPFWSRLIYYTGSAYVLL